MVNQIKAMEALLPFILIIGLSEIEGKETNVIQTTTGKVQGVIEPSSVPGKSVQKFLNIPYAEPPVGKLRFVNPVPKKPWNGTIGNSTTNIACWQKFNPNRNLTEDCLILNIWTPHPQTTNRSVMIWIHGGSFVAGRSGSFRGHNFVAVGDVVLVTINYRLSALGFLSTGDNRIKGNIGLFDQRLAMKWVKDNIASFGGNPQSITIFGLSAGAASVSAHTLSKDSWPFFDRAILQSGNLIMPWAVQTRSVIENGSRQFIRSLNCSDNDKLLECLQNITVEHLERIYNSKPYTFENVWFGPVVDGSFIADTPKKLWSNGTVKMGGMILGITKDETIYWDLPFLQTTRNISVIKESFRQRLRRYLDRYSASQAAYNQGLKLYQPECTPSFIEALRPIVDFSSDFNFLCSTTKEAYLRSQIPSVSEVYLYRYSYATPIPSTYFPRGSFGFAAHGHDAVSTFGVPINNPKYPSEDQILSLRMIIYWTNFAKHGDPNVGSTRLPVAVDEIDSLPKWPKFTNSSREFLDMESLSRMIVGKRLRETYCDFWNDPEGFTRRANQSATAMPASADPEGSTKKATTFTTSSAVKHIVQVALMVGTLLPIINQTF